MKIDLQDIVKQFGTLEAVSHVSLDIQDDHAGHVAGCRQHELNRTAVELRCPIG